MSEIILPKRNALLVTGVAAGSAAARAGIRDGDLLRAVNGKAILDILDYRFHAAASRLDVSIERQGATLKVSVAKRADEDAGLSFEHDLGDRVHTCKNKCVFCFIHQMPRKMRKSLYLMDDDFRLSFMHGNYVTLTNLTADEWERILEQRLSPLYVSVHAADPDLRGALLGRKEPAPVLPQIRELSVRGIDVHAQVVLCPGLNDGDRLERTLRELAAEHPEATGRRTGVQSVAVVPVGLTRFRERLPRLDHVERQYSRALIPSIHARQREYLRSLDTRFVWLADEWYSLAGRNVPGYRHYEQFPQLEDGIGTVRLFQERLRKLSPRLPHQAPAPFRATLVTAEMPSPIVHQLANRFNAVTGVDLDVLTVRNEFFGGDVRVAGLLTWTDIEAALSAPGCRGVVILPNICLRDDALFLDDVTLDEARRRCGRDLRVVSSTSPRALAEMCGLVRPARSRPEARGRPWLMEETVPSMAHA